MTDYAPEIQTGQTTYVLTKVDGKACYAAKGMETDSAFTFLCKTDKDTKQTVYVNFVSRAKYSTLPDVSNLDEPEPLDNVIEAGSTRYIATEIDDAVAYYPDSMGRDAPRRFVWFAKLDRLNSRHFFVNAETRAKAWMLPEITDHRERVIAMLRRYEPSAVDAADATSEEKYGGEWQPFLEALVAKHGREPGIIRRETRERLVAIFGRYAPQELAHVDAWLDKHEGQEEALIESLKSQYGTEPPTYRQRITAIYEKFNPEKLSSVDDGLRMYAGKELMLIAALVKKYGPEPHGDESQSLREKTPEELQEYRRRVTAMYTRYNPAKLNSVDQGLEMYRGQEELLMEALITKYGPEPTGHTPEEAIGKHPEPVSASSVADSADLPPAYGSMRSDAAGESSSPDQPSSPDTAREAPPKNDPAHGEVVEESDEVPPQAAEATAVADEGGEEAEEGEEEEEEDEGAAVAAASPEELEAYRRRVTALLTKYKPGRLSSVDTLMQQYAGQEAFLIEALVTKYGPEDDDSATAAAATTVTSSGEAPASAAPAVATFAPTQESDQQQQQPTSNNKTPTSGMARSTASSEGEDPAVTAALADKRPPHEKTSVERVTAIYAHYAPASISKVARAMDMYAENHAQLIEVLVHKYGPEPNFGSEEAEEATAAATTDNDNTTTEASAVVVAAAPSAPAAVVEEPAAAAEEPARTEAEPVSAERAATPVVAAAPAPAATTEAPSNPPQQDNVAAATVTAGAEAEAEAEEDEPVEKLSAEELAAIRRRVEAMFRLYKPSQLQNVDSLMQRYEGQEEFLMEALVNRYGPEPPQVSDPDEIVAKALADHRAPTEKTASERVLAIYAHYAPASIVKGLAALERYPDKDELIEVLVSKYGAEPHFGAPAPAAPLVAAATAEAPAALPPRGQSDGDLPASTTTTQAPSFADSPHTTDDTLVGSASLEITPPAHHPAAAPHDAAGGSDAGDDASTVAQSVAAATTSRGTYRERVMRFYLHYKPKKASDAIVDRALAMYSGQEEELIEELERKFGPEPPADAVFPPQESSPDPLSFDKNSEPDAIPASLVPSFAAMIKSAVPADQQYGTMMIRKMLTSSNPPANAIVHESIMPALVEHMKLGLQNRDLAFEAAWTVVLLAFTSAPHGALDLKPGSCTMLNERERITALYQRYAPEGLPNLPAMLARYAGQESLLIEILVRRHGPEQVPPQQRATAESLIAQYCPDMPQARVVAALNKFEGFEDVFVAALRMRYEGVDSHATPLHSPWSAAGDGEVITTPLAGSTVTTPMVTPRGGAQQDPARPQSRMSESAADVKRRDEEHAAARDKLEEQVIDAKEFTGLTESQDRAALLRACTDAGNRILAAEETRRLITAHLRQNEAAEAEARQSIVDEEYASRLFEKQLFTTTMPPERSQRAVHADPVPAAQPAAVEAAPAPTSRAPSAASAAAEEAPAPAAAPRALPNAPTAADSTPAATTSVDSPPGPQSRAETAPGARSPSPNGVASDAASEPSPVRELRRVIRETVIVDADPAVIAARDAHHLSIIGALATFEVRLREAYDKLNGAMIHSDSLREENVRLTGLLAEMRSSTHAEIEAARVEMEEAKRAAREIEREAELAKATMQSNISVSASAALHELEVERLRGEEMKLEHAKTIRSLHEDLNGLQDRKRESEMHSLHLNNRLKGLAAELTEANNAIELLSSQIAVAKPKADSWSQYSEDDFKPAVAASSNSDHHGDHTRSISPVREQRLQVARLSAELEEWKSIASRLNIELRSAERQHQELINAPCEECDTASIVIAALRDKNTKLESELQQLEMSYAAGPVSYSRVDDADLLRLDIARLKQLLAEANATTRSQRAEIQDLRGLLAIHMASPAKRRY